VPAGRLLDRGEEPSYTEGPDTNLGGLSTMISAEEKLAGLHNQFTLTEQAKDVIWAHIERARLYARRQTLQRIDSTWGIWYAFSH
jgi:hypothetical protein